jgi:hypothetical protein
MTRRQYLFLVLAMPTALAAAGATVVHVPRSYAAPNVQPNFPSDGPSGQRTQAGDQPQIVISPWGKFCLKAQDPNVGQVCFTGRERRPASEAPPSDPKAFDEKQKQLREELRKRAEAARRKLEEQLPPTR